jgi:succinylglutamate desuccinylase
MTVKELIEKLEEIENKEALISGDIIGMYFENVEINENQVITKESDEIIHFSMEKIKGEIPNYIEYKVGKLFYHKGHTIHQINKRKMEYGDRRITLQAHAVRCDGVYRVYF